MLIILAAIRDFLVAMALAWVGITVETEIDREPCRTEACETQNSD